MSRKLSIAAPAFCCLLIVSLAVKAEDGKPVIQTTAPRLTAAAINGFQIEGLATFTMTAANFDDTVTGIFIYTLSDDSRRKLARATGQDLSVTPASLTKKDVIAGFKKGTSCPKIQLAFAAFELEAMNRKISFDRVVLDFNETTEEMPQLLCAWTRQINANRHRRGIIAAINKLLRI